MEVKETAACGISQREFAIEFDQDEFVDMYRLLRYVKDGTGFYEEDFLDELKSQMSYIIGPSLDEEPPEDIPEEKMEWEDTGTSFNLNFNEEMSRKLRLILEAADHPGEGFDMDLLDKMMNQMMEINPTALENLPIINR
ncbi:MAG: hypothetical protein JRH18_15710 [Deltaproteobacteria bacterium]|nr:hypothetical protein [Deltaproteobacteria bacterium]MBW2153101.1 hypothetical protein [Deltaproteobacteria bacterium]